MPRAQRVAHAVALAAVALLLCAAGCRWAGLRVNTSPSIPLGLYRVSDLPVTRGAYVLLCPPQTPVFALARQRGYLGAGFCPGGYGYLMKKVLAAQADHIGFAADGVRVNGRLLAASAALPADQAGRRLSQHMRGSLTLGPDQLLLMSARPTAWDARYFGPVARAQVHSVIVPLLTWPAASGTTCGKAKTLPAGAGIHRPGAPHLWIGWRQLPVAVSANHGDLRHHNPSKEPLT
ncbi:MAG: conjugative transfer signal peptidase TraF [Comamonas sp.]